MTLGQIASKIRYLTKTDTVSYPDAQMLIDINIYYEKIVSMILESMDDANFDDNRNTTYPIATRPMVAGQRDYAFNQASWTLSGRQGGSASSSQAVLPLKVRRVDLTYDGTNYYPATMIDSGAIKQGLKYTGTTGTDSKLDQGFIPENPSADIAFNSLWVFPAPNAAQVTAGAAIRMEFDRTVTVFTTSDYSSVLTDSTVIPAFNTNFHVMLAYGPSLDFAKANGLPIKEDLKQDMAEYEVRLRQAYGNIDLAKQYTVGTVQADNNYGR